jgi:hypothetical protein
LFPPRAKRPRGSRNKKTVDDSGIAGRTRAGARPQSRASGTSGRSALLADVGGASNTSSQGSVHQNCSIANDDMDYSSIINDLHVQLEQLDHAIAHLESLNSPDGTYAAASLGMHRYAMF